jgi:hypothetical protein
MTRSLLALAVLALLAPAAQTCEGEKKVQVTVVAILAGTQEDGKIDERVHRLAEQVQKKHPELKSFRVGQTSRKPVTTTQRTVFPLVDKEVVEVTLVECTNPQERKYCLTIKAPLYGEITYTTCCDKYFPIVTRYRTRDKERLIIAIMVEPCK